MLKEIFTNIIGHAIVQSGRAIKIYNLNMFSELGYEITPEQFIVLSMLSETTLKHQNELCEELHKDKSNMTRLLAILEEKGLIEKIQATENKKQVNKIKITEKGKQIRDKIMPQMQKTRKNYLNGITEDEIYTCIKVLNKIYENLENSDMKEI